MRCALLTPLLDGVAWIVGRLPQPVVLVLGRALAWLGRPLLRSRRRIARINIDLCFPELDAAARARLVDETVANTVIGAFELIRAWHSPTPVLAPLATIDGLPRLREALARGGVLLFGGHMTHTEITVRLIGDAVGHPVHVVVRRHNDPCLEAWLERSRRRAFGGTIGKKDMRALLRTLHDGHPVAYSADQNFTYHHVFVPFFGVPAATMTAVPDIVARGRATMLPFTARRDERGHYHVRIGEAWAGWPSGDATRDAARYMTELEAVVRDAPAQYLWVHQRFKTRPPGEAPVY